MPLGFHPTRTQLRHRESRARHRPRRASRSACQALARLEREPLGAAVGGLTGVSRAGHDHPARKRQLALDDVVDFEHFGLARVDSQLLAGHARAIPSIAVEPNGSASLTPDAESIPVSRGCASGLRPEPFAEGPSHPRFPRVRTSSSLSRRTAEEHTNAERLRDGLPLERIRGRRDPVQQPEKRAATAIETITARRSGARLDSGEPRVIHSSRPASVASGPR